MKKLIIIPLVLGAVIGLAAIIEPPSVTAPAPEGIVTLAWDHPDGYPNGNPDWQYRIYSSPDMTNWTVLTNVAGTNAAIVLPIKRDKWFFYATTVDTTNFWKESDPSNVAQTPALPPSSGNFQIKFGAHK